jgi:hypothetical protein
MGVSRGAGAVGQQPPFSNMTMPDKQRQQQFMRQQMRQPHASGAMFGAQGQQQQPPSTPQPQQQVPMAQGGFPNMHAPMNQNFNMFQGGSNQPGMHVTNQQAQAQPQPQISQQGNMGQHFNQGPIAHYIDNFRIPSFTHTICYFRRKLPYAAAVAATSTTGKCSNADTAISRAQYE